MGNFGKKMKYVAELSQNWALSILSTSCSCKTTFIILFMTRQVIWPEQNYFTITHQWDLRSFRPHFKHYLSRYLHFKVFHFGNSLPLFCPLVIFLARTEKGLSIGSYLRFAFENQILGKNDKSLNNFVTTDTLSLEDQPMLKTQLSKDKAVYRVVTYRILTADCGQLRHNASYRILNCGFAGNLTGDPAQHYGA